MCIYIYIYIHIHTSTHIHISLSLYIYVYLCVCMRICICVYVYITYVCVYMCNKHHYWHRIIIRLVLLNRLLWLISLTESIITLLLLLLRLLLLLLLLLLLSICHLQDWYILDACKLNTVLPHATLRCHINVLRSATKPQSPLVIVIIVII